jgi:hypothetical protein
MTFFVFLTAHVTIVLHVAFGEIPSDVGVALDVPCSDISVFVAVNGVEIPMRRGFSFCISLAFIGRKGGPAGKEQYAAGQWNEFG